MVLGADGFCGWPTSLKLAKEGHDIIMIDNLSRRKIDLQLESNSLTNIYNIYDRMEAARKLGYSLYFINCDITDYDNFSRYVDQHRPDAIIHFAEQRAAPYSMKSHKERRYTVENNITGTHNVLNAIVDHSPNTHLVHLGTMGVYGYSKEFWSNP